MYLFTKWSILHLEYILGVHFNCQNCGKEFDPKYTTILCLTLILEELKIASFEKKPIQDSFVCGSVSARKNPHSPIYKESRSADFNCQNRVFHSKNVVLRRRKRIEESTKKNAKEIFLIRLQSFRYVELKCILTFFSLYL